MTCQSYHLLISRHLDGALDEQEQSTLLEHIGRCPSCRLTLYRYQRLDDQLRHLPAPGAPYRCRGELFRRVDAIGRGAGLSVRRAPGSLALASVVLACLVLGALVLLPAGGPTELAEQLTSLWSDGSGGSPIIARASNEGSPASIEDADIALAGYLPPSSSVEQVALRWDETAKRPAYVQIVFVAPRGTKVRFERTVKATSAEPASDLDLTKAIVVHGEVWRYADHVNANGVQTVRLVHSSNRGDLIVLEGSASLDELIDLLQWLQ